MKGDSRPTRSPTPAGRIIITTTTGIPCSATSRGDKRTGAPPLRGARHFFCCAFSIFAQVSRSVTDRLKTSAPGWESRIDAEISQSLELELPPGAAAGQARLQPAARQHLQRIRVQVGPVVRAFRHVVGVGLGEQVIVEPHFRLDGVSAETQ